MRARRETCGVLVPHYAQEEPMLCPHSAESAYRVILSQSIAVST